MSEALIVYKPRAVGCSTAGMGARVLMLYFLFHVLHENG